MSGRQSVMTRVKSVGENAPEIEIDEPGLRIKEKIPMRQHLFERRSPRLQLHATPVPVRVDLVPRQRVELPEEPVRHLEVEQLRDPPANLIE